MPTSSILFTMLIHDTDDDLDLVFGMNVRSDARDTDLVDVLQTHVQILGDVVVGSARDETQLILAIVNGHGVRIELIVLFANQVQLGANLEVLKGLAAIPKAETGDVEVGQMDLLHGFVFSVFHNALWFVIVSVTNVKRGCSKMWDNLRIRHKKRADLALPIRSWKAKRDEAHRILPAVGDQRQCTLLFDGSAGIRISSGARIWCKNEVRLSQIMEQPQEK